MAKEVKGIWARLVVQSLGLSMHCQASMISEPRASRQSGSPSDRSPRNHLTTTSTRIVTHTPSPRLLTNNRVARPSVSPCFFLEVAAHTLVASRLLFPLSACLMGSSVLGHLVIILALRDAICQSFGPSARGRNAVPPCELKQPALPTRLIRWSLAWQTPDWCWGLLFNLKYVDCSGLVKCTSGNEAIELLD